MTIQQIARSAFPIAMIAALSTGYMIWQNQSLIAENSQSKSLELLPPLAGDDQGSPTKEFVADESWAAMYAESQKTNDSVQRDASSPRTTEDRSPPDYPVTAAQPLGSAQTAIRLAHSKQDLVATIEDLPLLALDSQSLRQNSNSAGESNFSIGTQPTISEGNVLQDMAGIGHQKKITAQEPSQALPEAVAKFESANLVEAGGAVAPRPIQTPRTYSPQVADRSTQAATHGWQGQQNDGLPLVGPQAGGAEFTNDQSQTNTNQLVAASVGSVMPVNSVQTTDRTQQKNSNRQVINNPLFTNSDLGPSNIVQNLGAEQPVTRNVNTTHPFSKTMRWQEQAGHENPRLSSHNDAANPNLMKDQPTLADAVPSTESSSLTSLDSQSQEKQRFPALKQNTRLQILKHLEYGNSLARRSATRLAKNEFHHGLSLIAESADNSQNSAQHLQALKDGFRALREAGDFQSKASLNNVNIQLVAQGHETPIIRSGHFRATTPSQARKAYLMYAQSRIVQSVGHEKMAAEMLHALAKIHLVASMYEKESETLDFARAAILFQTSLLVDPGHARSGNELAVMLAQSGRVEDSKILLQCVVQDHPNFQEAWQNLEKLHRLLGEERFAGLAQAEVQRLQMLQENDATVRVVSNQEFDTIESAMGSPENIPASISGPSQSSGSQVEPASVNGNGKFRWLRGLNPQGDSGSPRKPAQFFGG